MSIDEKELLAHLIAHKGSCKHRVQSCLTCICNSMCCRGLGDTNSDRKDLYEYAKFLVQTKYSGDDAMSEILFAAII